MCCSGSDADDFFVAHLGPEGRLDPAFAGGAGIAKVDGGGADEANVVLWGADESVLVGGSATAMDSTCRLVPGCLARPALARFTAAGNPDPSFGKGGLFTIDSLAGADPYGDGVLDLIPHHGGGVIAAGGGGPGGSVAFLAAVSAKGVLEQDFGTGGIIQERSPEPSEQIGTPALAVTSDGKILAADWNNAGAGYGAPSVIRYSSKGKVDHSFGAGKGYVQSSGTDNAVALAVDKAGGSALLTNPGTVSRFTPGGRVDPRFAKGGSVTLKSAPAHFRAIAVLPEGRTLVAGTTDWLGGRSQMLVARLLPNGRLDPAFGRHGYATVGCRHGDRCKANRILVQGDGRILLAGRVLGSHRGIGRYSEESSRMALARLMPNGAPDRSFGHDGLATLRVSSHSEANALAIVPGGIVVAGWGLSRSGSIGVLARFRFDGSLDRGFGKAGLVRAFPRKSGIPTEILPTRRRILVVTRGPRPVVLDFGRDGHLDRGYRRLPKRVLMPRLVSGPTAALQHGKVVLAWTQSRRPRSSFPITLRLTRLSDR